MMPAKEPPRMGRRGPVRPNESRTIGPNPAGKRALEGASRLT